VLLVPDLETVGDFLDNAIGVLRTYGIDAVVLDRAPCVAPTGSIDTRLISVVIHVRGDLSGVTWQFPIAVTRHAASVIAPELGLDPEILELAASELANVLTGRGMTALSSHGVEIEIEPPQITPTARAGVTGQLTTELGSIVVIFHRGATDL
jgi:CheY-specific phosphatase CheX